ncbi:hypothetical protein BGZ98_001926 [Dissophora globulifera]|nr:hypothetical protein BGZ98_001926 [Dissophora globulifera]
MASLLSPNLHRGRPHSFQIEISGIPAENGKCRVETQLKIGIHLRRAQGSNATLDYRQLCLPRTLIAKEKHRIEKFSGRDRHLQDSEILTLDARLVCDHDVSKVLECCDNCIGRERKRAHRRKEAPKPQPGCSAQHQQQQVQAHQDLKRQESQSPSTPAALDAINPKTTDPVLSMNDEINPPTPTDPVAFQAWERSRIMVFCSTQYIDITPAGDCILPTRITCYCRHHCEKVGFRIQFTARDSTGAVVASTLTNPVMMMDDHKSGKRAMPAEMKVMTGSMHRHSPSAAAYAHSQQHIPQQLPFSSPDLDDDKIDLEAGHNVPNKRRSEQIKLENEDGNEAMLSSLSLAVSQRMVAKRRIDDAGHTSQDFQAHQSLRRKISHDITQPYHFPCSTFAFPSINTGNSTTLLSPSPFMPGSPFANDEDPNAFTSWYDQAKALGSCGGMILSSAVGQKCDPMHAIKKEQGFHQESVSLLENYTAIDESMSSPMSEFYSPGSSALFLTGVYSPALSAGVGAAVGTRASFSIPISTHHQHPTSGFLYSPPLPFSPSAAPVPDPSILETTQVRLLNSLHQAHSPDQGRHQQQHQQQQQHQRYRQMPSASSDASIQVPWNTTPPPESGNMLDSDMKTPPSALLSSFIPIPASPPHAMDLEYRSTTVDTDVDTDGDPPMQFPDIKGWSHPCKNLGITVIPPGGSTGMLRKPRFTRSGSVTTGADTESRENSPMTSPRAPSTSMPPSPSPPPCLGYPTSTPTTPPTTAATLTAGSNGSADIGSTTAVASAQLLLNQQQHQLQLRLRQKQAIVARQHLPHRQLYQQQQLSQLHALQQLQQYHPFHQQQHQQQQQRIQGLQHRPCIQRLVPAKGSIDGGIEVTLLGSGFFPGMVPMFDGVPASIVQFYGPETVICRLPPRAQPGVVVVKATTATEAIQKQFQDKQHQRHRAPSASNSQEFVQMMRRFLGGSSTASLSVPQDIEDEEGDDNCEVDIDGAHNNFSRQYFKSTNDDNYNDGSDHNEGDNDDSDEDSVVGATFEYEESKGGRDLIALALQVLGMKMNGMVESPHQVAMRIMATAAAQQQQMADQQQLQLERQQQRQQELMQREQQEQLQQLRKHQQTTVSSSASPSTVSTAKSRNSTQRSGAPGLMASATPVSALTPIPLQSPQSQLLFRHHSMV